MLANGSTAIDGRAGRRGGGVGRGRRGVEAIDPHRLGDVLDRLRAEIDDRQVELALDLVEHRAGNADTAGIGERLEPSGDVYAVAVDVVAIHNDVAEVDPDPQFNPVARRHVLISTCEGSLDLERALGGIHRARELDQHAITGGFDDAAVVLGDTRVEHLNAMRL